MNFGLDFVLAEALEDFQAGEINETALAVTVNLAMAEPQTVDVASIRSYTVDLFKVPELLKEWLLAFPPDTETIIELLQRIIEHNLVESYQAVKKHVPIKTHYYLRLRPYLLNDSNAELLQLAKNELNAYDPCHVLSAGRGGESETNPDLSYPFPNALKEKYFGYRKMWHLLTYGPRDLKEKAIREWSNNKFDCTFSAALDHHFWKKGEWPIPDDEIDTISEQLYKMDLEDLVKYFLP